MEDRLINICRSLFEEEWNEHIKELRDIADKIGHVSYNWTEVSLKFLESKIK